MEAASPDANTGASQREFPCSSCGAKLHFAPGSDALTCPYCGAQQQIATPSQPVVERSFEQALRELARRPASTLAQGGHEIQCKGCGAITLLSGHASSCPFCDSPLVVPVEEDRETIVPESVLPFKIEQREAGQKFKEWVTSRWFAPNDLAARAQRASIDGVYLPYYTYDARAESDYVGQRGEYYYETEHYKDAQGNSQTRQVRKTRWYPAAGHVRVDFDDVLVCASKSLPMPLVDALEPWDLAELRSFDPAFLSGFMAERAALDLREGFGVVDRDGAAGDRDPTVAGELVELLIHAFATDAEHRSEFPLGDLDTRAAARRSVAEGGREPEQVLGEAVGQVQEHQVGDSLIGAAETK